MRTLYYAAALVLLAAPVRAQFMPSTVPETGIGSSSGVTKISNDQRQYAPTSADKGDFNVIVWDGSAPRLTWFSDHFGFAGSLPLPPGCSRPDVVLSSGPTGDLFAVVVYILGGNFRLSPFHWDAGLAAFVPMGSVSWPIVTGSVAPTINIDADWGGNYVIAQGQGNGMIQVYKGTNADLAAAMPPTAWGTLAPGTGQQVDISLNYIYYTAVSGTPTNLHLVYANMTRTMVFTRSEAFATSGFSVPAVVGSGATFNLPRIASPLTNASCSSDIFSIVCERTIGTSTRIWQYHESGGITTGDLTDGIGPHPVPALNNNRRPAITYSATPSSCVGRALCGWTNTGDTVHPLVGMKVRGDGALWATGISPSTYYDLRCSPGLASPDLVALSSKNAGELYILESYYSGNTIVYKRYHRDANSMRLAAPAVPATQHLQVFPNPTRGTLHLSVTGLEADVLLTVTATDLTGRMAYRGEGTLPQLQEALSQQLVPASAGVYLLQFTGGNGFRQQVRLVKQ